MLIKLVLLVNPSKATALSSFSPVITSLFIYHWLHIYIFLCLSVQKSQLHQAHVFIGLSHALLYSVSPTPCRCVLTQCFTVYCSSHPPTLLLLPALPRWLPWSSGTLLPFDLTLPVWRMWHASLWTLHLQTQPRFWTQRRCQLQWRQCSPKLTVLSYTD